MLQDSLAGDCATSSDGTTSHVSVRRAVMVQGVPVYQVRANLPTLHHHRLGVVGSVRLVSGFDMVCLYVSLSSYYIKGGGRGLWGI